MKPLLTSIKHYKKPSFTIACKTISIAFLTMSLLSSQVYANDDEQEESEPADVSNSFDFQKTDGVVARMKPHGNDLMGDMIDNKTGAISFEHTDISIPGNSSLEVALRRKLSQSNKAFSKDQQAFGDWAIDLPIAHVTYGYDNLTAHPRFDGGCMTDYGDLVGRSINRYNNLASTVFNFDVHIDGRVLSVPGKGLSGFQSKPNSYTVGLLDPKADWISGGREDDYNGECAEVTIAPDGTKYKFGRHTFREAQEMSVPVYYIFTAYERATSQGYTWINLPRRHVVYLVTEVEDIHGNWVRYQYNNDSELTRIYSNDGRSISLTYSDNEAYNSRQVSKVTANGREWNYEYDGYTLTKTVLPDGRSWEFGVNDPIPMRAMKIETYSSLEDSTCEWSFSIKHPDGAIGDFVTTETSAIKNVFEFEDVQNASTTTFGVFSPEPTSSDLTKCNFFKTDEDEPEENKKTFRTMSLVSKTISGSNIPTATWKFEYREKVTGLKENSSYPIDETWTNITEPDGTNRVYTYHTIGDNHGLLARLDVLGKNGARESFEYDYDLSQDMPANCHVAGATDRYAGVCRTYAKRPQTKVKHTRDGTVYTTERQYNKNSNGVFTDNGRANKVTFYSTLQTPKRILETEYWHNRSANIIGKVAKVERNDKEFVKYGYTSKGLTSYVNKLGVRWETYAYNGDGTLKTATDAVNNTATLSSYYRGQPRTITHRDGTTFKRTVDANGWVTSETDAKDTTYRYTYNKAGWMTSVDRPTPWSDTSVTYHNVGRAGFYSSERRDSKESLTYYDVMLRPTLTRQRPLSGGGINTYVKTEYDSLGRAIFTSFPSTRSNPLDGVDTTYDGLGRVIETRENVSPYATTTTEYLTQNRILMTDPNVNRTTIHQTGYGSPSDGDVRIVVSPEGVATRMTYDIFGNITQLRQKDDYDDVEGTAQLWSYDSRFRVCRHYVPETGSKLYQYDNADRVTAYVEGESGTTGCASLPSTNKVTLSYDKRGRNTLVNYPSGTSDISKTYDVNGNLTKVNRGGINWTYTYNNINLLTSEKLDIDGRNYDSTYTYNIHEEMTARRLPSGKTLTYTHDGLGMVTSIKHGSSTYASNIMYSPFGSVGSLKYGNGLWNFNSYYAQGMRRTNLVEDGDSGLELDFAYRYDANKNLTEVRYEDEKEMTYDGLNRLRTATGLWGNARYFYDAYGNLKTKIIDSRRVTNRYDRNTNRLTSSTDTASETRTVSYDSRGNITSIGDLNFNYDGANQPISMSGSSSGSYKYDGNLKRVKAVVNGKTIYNVFDASGQLVYIDKVSEGEKTEYIHGAGTTIARLTNNTVTYLHNDVMGTPIKGSNSSSRTVFREYYTPYGEKIVENSANDDLGGYTGHIYDKDTGLTYMQARYYDPVIGRFYSNDPVGTLGHFSDGNLQGFNRYAYANNNPYKYTDPDGEVAQLAACFGGPVGCAIGVSLLVYAAYEGVTGTQEALQNSGPMFSESGEDWELDYEDWANGNSDDTTEHGGERDSRGVDKETTRSNGERFRDTETGAIVFVDGNKVVIDGQNGNVTSWGDQTDAETTGNVETGKWEPIDE